jgi:hypothetical protein
MPNPLGCVLEVSLKVRKSLGLHPGKKVHVLLYENRIEMIPIALNAAGLSASLKIPKADSFMLATSRAFEATLRTQDEDFQGLDDIRYQSKPSS